MAGGVAHVVEVVVLAAGAAHFCEGWRRSGRVGVSSPVKTFLNWTMPALASISVGSLLGTSGAEGTNFMLGGLGAK